MTHKVLKVETQGHILVKTDLPAEPKERQVYLLLPFTSNQGQKVTTEQLE